MIESIEIERTCKVPRMLEDRSFNAVIADGQIRYGENLTPSDGKEVHVTVHVRALEVEPPEDFDIEKDVSVKMPVETTVLGAATIRNVGSAIPSLILPEGFGDA